MMIVKNIPNIKKKNLKIILSDLVILPINLENFVPGNVSSSDSIEQAFGIIVYIFFDRLSIVINIFLLPIQIIRERKRL